MRTPAPLCTCGTRMLRTGTRGTLKIYACPTCEPWNVRHEPRPDNAETPYRYGARWVRFLLEHAWEIHDRDTLLREWAVLPKYGICTCASATWRVARDSGTPLRGGPRRLAHAPMPLTAEEADLQRAYAALPVDWLARTEMMLALDGHTGDQIREMKVCNACLHTRGKRLCEHERFWQTHVDRVDRERGLPLTEHPVVWHASLGQSVADFLNGRVWVPGVGYADEQGPQEQEEQAA